MKMYRAHKKQTVTRRRYLVRVWVAGKTVWFPCYTRAISERFWDRG